jgi:uroporphyrin-III C-methyltransferase
VSNRFQISGTVYLTGAGPGAANLLTLRAVELLGVADLVLHDDLVSSEVLALIPPRTAVHNVGKRCGEKRVTQEEINRRMIAAARSGQTVVRLKGGDPLIFGRTQDEIRALREENIPFEIVPGITAATAAAAEAKIPLTERKVASRLVFLSNHAGTEKMHRDWHKPVASDATLVFYMPGGDFSELTAELGARGFGADTPCLLISNASRPGQRIVRTVIGELNGAPTLAAPSVLIVGGAVAEARGCEELRLTGESHDLTAETEQILLLDRDDERVHAG